MKVRDRVIGIERHKGSNLVPHPMNWRTHPTQQIDALKGILAEVGNAGCVIGFKQADGSVMLIDGHARAEIMTDQEIPVIILDVTREEADKLLATYDPVGDLAGFDDAKFQELMDTLDLESPALLQMAEEMMAAMEGEGSPCTRS